MPKCIVTLCLVASLLVGGRPACSGEVLYEFDTPPVVLTRVAADYPEEARAAGMEEDFSLLVFVNESGDVTEILLLDKGGCRDEDGLVREDLLKASEGSILARSAAAAVIQWKFKPAQLDGEDVECTITIPMEFRLRSVSK